MMDTASCGVIYYNRGFKCLPRLIVSLHSLRKHYKGKVTLMQEGPLDQELERKLKAELNVDLFRDDNAGVATLVRKIQISEKTPYDITVFIDADTLITGDISDLFEMAQKSKSGMVAVNFAGWKTDGRTIARRIAGYKSKYPELVDPAIKFGPAINTGVYAYRKDIHPLFAEWFEIAQWGESQGMFIPDEIACQLIAPKYGIEVAHTKYNASCNYDPNTPDLRIIHYHGKKHTKSKLAWMWLTEFLECVRENVCNIRNLLSQGKDFLGDRRLRKFMSGNYENDRLRRQIKRAFKHGTEGVETQSVASAVSVAPVTENDLIQRSKYFDKVVPSMEELIQETTVVTACDPKYVAHLQVTYPNWARMKNITSYPMIVYVQGFIGGVDNPELDFLRGHPNLRIIPWDFPSETQRERMLSAFVFGVAKDVETKYWIKLDADAFASDQSSLVLPEMVKYSICGHKWHYTKPGKWIEVLDKWARKKKEFQNTKAVFDPTHLSGRRYMHERVASYAQFHNTEFTRMAATLAGKRLPVPSHDTYLWYVVSRLGLPWKRTNFKRLRGMSNKTQLDRLTSLVNAINVNANVNVKENVEEPMHE